MAKLTIVFGVVLILVGIAGFVETGSHYPTALIPSVIGLILAIAGALAITPNEKRRGLWMHVAATVGVLGFLGTLKGAYDVIRLSKGVEYPHPIAVVEKGATCLICLIFVAFCIRSFIEARRARVLAGGAR